MTTRSQKRETVEELVSADLETALSGNNQNVNPVAGTSNSPKIQTEKLEERKSTIRKEILSDLTKILAEIQKEIAKTNSSCSKKTDYTDCPL